MNESKMRKTITAITVAATMLIVLLLSVLIGQWIKISVQNRRIADARERVAVLEQEVEDKEDDLDVYLSEYYKDWASLKLGYVLGE